MDMFWLVAGLMGLSWWVGYYIGYMDAKSKYTHRAAKGE